VTVLGKDNAQVFFVLEEIVTLNYESHVHAYLVRVLNKRAIAVGSQFFRPQRIFILIFLCASY